MATAAECSLISDGSFTTAFDAEISGLTITGGDATGAGGAVNSRENLTLSNSIITGNAARGNSFNGGGGVFSDGNYANSSLAVLNCVISNNVALNGEGGGIRNTGSDLTVVDTAIRGNVAGSAGGGISAADLGITVDIRNSFIDGNSSNTGSGGGVFLFDATASITNCTISNNTARNNGGGIFATGYFESISVTIENSTLSGNTATVGGGGIYMRRIAPVPAVGILSVRHSTITNNAAATNFGGVWLLGVSRDLLFVDHCRQSGPGRRR